MTKKTKPQCETGATAATALDCLVAPAIADWKKRRRKPSKSLAAKMLSGTVDYIGTLPPPPTATEDYFRCIGKWMAAYSEAQGMNTRQDQIAYAQAALAYVNMWPSSSYATAYAAYLTQQVAILQTEQAQHQVVLTALIGAYLDCMSGIPV